MLTIKKYPLEDLDLQDCLESKVPLVIQTPGEWELDELRDALRSMQFSMYRFPHDVVACARQDAVNSTTTLEVAFLQWRQRRRKIGAAQDAADWSPAREGPTKPRPLDDP